MWPFWRDRFGVGIARTSSLYRKAGISPWLLLILLFVSAAAARRAAGQTDVVQWSPYEIRLQSSENHPWWIFPAAAEFVHEPSGKRLALEAYWDGERQWVVRFAPPLAGRWTWRTKSEEAALNGRTGEFNVHGASAQAIAENPNLRGHVRISKSGRYFEYADGTPFLLLADTLWSGNTARCGLGEHGDGPFFQYLADRQAKGFTAVLMKYVNGFDDYVDLPTGERNEGGYAFLQRDFDRLNPAYFQALDKRLDAFWQRGLIAAVPVAWWGKSKLNAFTSDQAQRLSAYCAVRYSAFNALWCLSGEYQYTFHDCGWTAADIDRLGKIVQAHNPYRHPVSIHPSARLDWPAPHNTQSSRPFHASKWLDHHWLQTGQSVDRMFNIVTRAAENRKLTPARPVFCAEAHYDRQDDPDQTYHARWQIWTAMLSGCAGYGYGAQGMWQVFDTTDERGETGKNVSAAAPWREALRFKGSSMIRPARTLLETMRWWRLEPQRSRLLVGGQPNPPPTSTDLSPPHCAAVPDEFVVVYIPRGNSQRSLEIVDLNVGNKQARWFDPRTGHATRFDGPAARQTRWTVPARPAPADEDWVLILGSDE